MSTMADDDRVLRRSRRRKRPMMCKLCGGALHDPTPPKRPRRNRAVSAAAQGGGTAAGCVPQLCQSSSGLTATRDRETFMTSAYVHSIFTPSGTVSGQALPEVSNSSRIQPHSAPTSASIDLASVTAPCNSSGEFTFSAPISLRCTDTQTPPSSNTTIQSASSSGPIFSGQSELSRNSDDECSPTTAGVSPRPSSTADNQFPSTTTAKASSAPVFASYTPDKDETHSTSAPPSLFPLPNQAPVSGSSSSSNRSCSPAYLTPSSTVSNQFFGQSVTADTSDRASAESQPSGSTFCPPVFSSAPVSTSSDWVFRWPAATNNSSCSTFASTQSNTVAEAQKSPNSTSSGSKHFCGSLPGTSSSTSGTCTTSSFVPGFGIESSGTSTHGSSTQSFVFSTLSNNTFRCGNGVSTESNMDVGQPLGTPVPRTTCWRWHENDSQASSTVAPSSRSSQFSQQTPFFGNFDAVFRPASRPDSCQPTIRTSSQAITGVDVGGTLPPTTLFQSPTWQQQNANDRRSQTSVSWARQNAVMSTTTSSQCAPRDASFPNSSLGIFYYKFRHKMNKKLSYCRDSARRRSLRRSRSFKVADFGTNRKPVCDFLLVNNNSVHPISYRLPDIAQY